MIGVFTGEDQDGKDIWHLSPEARSREHPVKTIAGAEAVKKAF